MKINIDVFFLFKRNLVHTSVFEEKKTCQLAISAFLYEDFEYVDELQDLQITSEKKKLFSH